MSNVTALRQDIRTAVDVEVGGFEDVPPVMSPKTLAGVLEVTPLTLQRWRDASRAAALKGGGMVGPAWSEMPGSNVIRYTRSDVLAWLASNRVQS